MLLMYLVLPLLLLILLVGALADIIMAEEWRVKHLPKVFWIIIVILMPLVGSILWFAIGREYARPVNLGGFGDPRRREVDAPATSLEPLTPGSFGVRNTEAELAALDREIEAYEKAERIRQLEEQLRERRREKGIEG